MQQKATDIDIKRELKILSSSFQGDIYTDQSSLLQYATDASAYREVPAAVVRPQNCEDIRKLVLFAGKHSFPIIPRTAGTSLAGQVVGNGIIADVSKYMTRILEINPEEKWVRVEPGVVLDELNKELEHYGLFFGPETSTSNRCMIGGMVGNNACGAHSLVYGSTREHLLSAKAILSDGSEAVFGPLTKMEFEEKCRLQSLEGKIYRNIRDMLSDPGNREEIIREFPDPSVERRNTGYALDILLDSEVFSETDKQFNLCKLLAGSEGTLAFLTEITLNLVELPPPEKAVVCVHCNSLEEAFRGNLIALQHRPVAVELMDSVVLEQTKNHLTQKKNRFFLKGNPAAILIVEFAGNNREEIIETAARMESAFREAGYGYHFPLLFGSDITKVWALRKAGLGLLSNIPGDAKPVAVTEDTAVNPEVLPEYIAEFNAMLDSYGLQCVYHAHIATGELHLRPVLNLKDPKDVELFHTVALESAKLVKKYRGSLSGEHGDGRLRGEFIPLMIGEKNYQLLKDIKKSWDPQGIFNPGKITDTPAMNTFLRYDPKKKVKEISTIFDFSGDQGILRSAEKCNGSGDCRRSEIFGGTMCPSYQATRDENTTTRARANILREFLTYSERKNPFDHKEIYDILDLCLSCKGCKSECPSSVDMAKLKAEFLQHYYDANGIPFRAKAIAYISHLNRLAMIWPAPANFFFRNAFTSSLLKRVLGFAPKRSIPMLYKYTLRAWYGKYYSPPANPAGRVYLFCDEFSNYNDTEIGINTVRLLTSLGYEVVIPDHGLSGRTFISKGLVRKAQKIAQKNILALRDLITPETPLLGIEPSGILTFRDEYPDLAGEELRNDSKRLATSCLMVDEFIVREFEKGNIKKDLFTDQPLQIKLHGHCQQKSVASTRPTIEMLSIPENYSVTEMKTGCCGMAGSFGYEKEHYELSMKVGELVLFPEIRKTEENVVISAPGTSCRHQIKDGTGRKAQHPVEILFKALKQH